MIACCYQLVHCYSLQCIGVVARCLCDRWVESELEGSSIVHLWTTRHSEHLHTAHHATQAINSTCSLWQPIRHPNAVLGICPMLCAINCCNICSLDTGNSCKIE